MVYCTHYQVLLCTVAPGTTEVLEEEACDPNGIESSMGKKGSLVWGSLEATAQGLEHAID